MHIKAVANSIFQTVVIDIEPKDYDKKDKTFSFEMSDKDLGGAPRIVRLRNPKTNKTMDFEMYKKDYDSTHEDIYGYWYKNKDGYKLLLIND
jgi:hypothetical protein